MLQKFGRPLYSHDFVNQDGWLLHSRLIALGIEAKAIDRNDQAMVIFYEWPYSALKVRFQIYYMPSTSELWLNVAQGYHQIIRDFHKLYQSIMQSIEDGDG